MATTQDILPGLSLNASADLRTHTQKFVVVSGVRTVNVAGAGVAAIGVLENAPNTGEAATVTYKGICKVICGAAVTAGAKVMSNASGLAITATATNHVVGIAVSTTANANEILEIIKIPPTILA